MMWNWLVSSLASNASIVLYDGSPFIPNYEYLFEIAEKEKINVFWYWCKIYRHIKKSKN